MILQRNTTRNPYLVAYADANNIKDGEDVRPIDYMEWIDKKHSAFRKERGLPEHIELNINQIPLFLAFIGYKGNFEPKGV